MFRRAAHLPCIVLLGSLAAMGCGRESPARASAAEMRADTPAPSPRRLFVLPQGPRQGFSAGAVSPDGRQFAYALTEGDAENIWVADIATGRAGKVTDHHDAVRIWPQWSRDSKLLTYLVHYDSGRNQVAVVDVASKVERIVWTADRNHWPDGPLFWPDGRIVFMRRGWPSAPHAGDAPPPEVWQITYDGVAKPLEEAGDGAPFPSRGTPVASPDQKLAAWVGPVYQGDPMTTGVWIVDLTTAK